MRAVKPLADRFWAKVRRHPGDACWEWLGATNGVGYGVIWRGPGERKDYAHRISWELHHGPIPDGVYVCHRCDNPPCPRPDHLFLGSNSENIADSVRKGRFNRQRGEERPSAKLTVADVLEIRRLAALCHKRGGRRTPGELSLRMIAEQFGIALATVRDIVHRRKWASV